jgi:hypothetical protein
LRHADRADAEPAGEPGSDVLNDDQQLGAVVLQPMPGLSQRERQASDLGPPDGLLAAGIRRHLAPR